MWIRKKDMPRGELLGLVLLSAAACTAAGEFEPMLVGSESAAGAPATAAPSAPESPGSSPASPVLAPGETKTPVSLLPGADDGNAGDSRSGAEEASVILDGGVDASVADAGDSIDPDAGARIDAGALDASTPLDPNPPGPDDPNPDDPNPDDPGPGEPNPDDPNPGDPGPVDPAPVDAGAPPASEPCPGLVFEDSCYEFFDAQVSWGQAEARCIEWGGHLASVESPEEDAFIGAWPALLGVPLVDGSGLWLGGTDAASDGNFRWWDDRPLSFTAWASDQPNNGAGVDCIEKRNDTTQRWYDRRCTDVERYVCERPE